MCWRKQAKIRSLLLQFLPQKRRIPTSVYIRFWGNQTKLIRVKAVSTVLTSVFRPLSGINIQHLQDVANVQLLVRPRPHI